MGSRRVGNEKSKGGRRAKLMNTITAVVVASIPSRAKKRHRGRPRLFDKQALKRIRYTAGGILQLDEVIPKNRLKVRQKGRLVHGVHPHGVHPHPHEGGIEIPMWGC